MIPQAFIAAMEGDDEQEFRQRCLVKVMNKVIRLGIPVRQQTN
ncbi:hypothetical protein [Candidatus Enterovibrio escicola]|nr:hypothetical protein [Candidatus Enterovibrio escacola]